MNKFIKALNKYIILFIIVSLFQRLWMYLRAFLYSSVDYDSSKISYIDYMPTVVDYLITLTTIVLLIIDFRKYQLKNVVIACIASLFFPLLGVVIFAIVFLLNEKAEAVG